MNPRGFLTLFYKEVLRFWKVLLQTLVAPVMTTLLYLLVFGHVLEGTRRGFPGRGLQRVPRSRPDDDGGDPERLRQFVLEPDPVQGRGQYHLPAAYAAVASRVFRRVRARGLRARPAGRYRRVAGGDVVRATDAGASGVPVVVRVTGQRHARRARRDRRHLGGEVRPARRVSRISSCCRYRFSPACFTRFIRCRFFGRGFRTSTRSFT